MDKENILVKIPNDILPEPCIDYDKETGKCKSSDKPCDACYENSFKVFD